MSTTWVQRLRELHDRSFDYDWTAHVQALNERLGLDGPRELATPAPGLPPSWFVGDVENLEPDRWVLFVGLNQKRSPDDEAWHLAQGYSEQKYWDYWRLLNRTSWYAHFYAPRVRIAAAALGLEIPRERERQQEIATTNAVFVEMCPYSSGSFGFEEAALQRLSEGDNGFRIVADVRRILVEEARPALVVVSGNQAVTVLEHADRDHLKLGGPVRYRSDHDAQKMLRHREGRFAYAESSVPVIGCPALRTRSAHNAYVEIDQLGDHARELVRDGLPSASRRR